MFTRRLLAMPRHLFGKSMSLRFLIVGAVNTVFAFTAYAVFIYIGLTVALASLFSLMTSILISFLTQGIIVFGGVSVPAFGRFAGAWALIYIVNLAELRFLVACGFDAYTAAGIALFPTTAFSFLIQRSIVFRKRRSA